MDQAEVIQLTREALEPRAHTLIAVYLFGSMARKTARPNSDVDLALLLKEQPSAGLAGLGFDLAFELEQKLKRRVDVVILNHAPADLAHRVLRDGVLVLDQDRRARVAFEVHSRAQFFDLAPLRARYRHGSASLSQPGAAKGA